jgi:hypothetical protein
MKKIFLTFKNVLDTTQFHVYLELSLKNAIAQTENLIKCPNNSCGNVIEAVIITEQQARENLAKMKNVYIMCNF